MCVCVSQRPHQWRNKLCDSVVFSLSPPGVGSVREEGLWKLPVTGSVPASQLAAKSNNYTDLSLRLIVLLLDLIVCVRLRMCLCVCLCFSNWKCASDLCRGWRLFRCAGRACDPQSCHPVLLSENEKKRTSPSYGINVKCDKADPCFTKATSLDSLSITLFSLHRLFEYSLVNGLTLQMWRLQG